MKLLGHFSRLENLMKSLLYDILTIFLKELKIVCVTVQILNEMYDFFIK